MRIDDIDIDFSAAAAANKERRRASLEDGTVYVIAAVGSPFIKVGWTMGDPKSRLIDMQTGCPLRLEHIASWPGGRACEGFPHDMLTRFGMHYRAEWFSFPGYEILRETTGQPAAAIGVALANGFVEERGGWEAMRDQLLVTMREACHA